MEWDAGEGLGIMEEDDITTRRAREGIMCAIRLVMGGNHTLPDPCMDV